MTRDEAIEILKRPGSNSIEQRWLDAFVALGMLKLDEPKSVGERIEEAISSLSNKECASTIIQHEFIIRGLKIVPM